MTSDPTFVPLGAVMALHVGLDPSAGEPDEMIRDMMTFRVMRKLMVLPATIDVARLDHELAADIAGWKLAKAGLDQAASQDAALDLVAVGLMMKAAGPEGGLLAGYRWRFVARTQVDKGALAIEALEANRRMERWL